MGPPVIMTVSTLLAVTSADVEKVLPLLLMDTHAKV